MKFLFFEKKYHTDLTQENIQNLVIRFANHPMVISRVVIIMSHGNKTVLFDVDHKGYNFNRVIRNPFSSNNNPHLKDTLKLIVIQACRGEVEPFQLDESPYDSQWCDRYSNLCLAKSSLEDYKSVRFTHIGCPYIKQITLALEKQWRTHNINKIFNDVAASMQNEYENLNLTPEFSVLGHVTVPIEDTFMKVLKASSRNLGNINSLVEFVILLSIEQQLLLSKCISKTETSTQICPPMTLETQSFSYIFFCYRFHQIPYN